METIANCAFRECRSLAELTFPVSLKTIANCAFWCCTSLGSLALPDSLKTIGGGAFRECRSLGELSFGDSLKTIGGLAFSGCRSLGQLTLPDSLEFLGSGALDTSLKRRATQRPTSVYDLCDDNPNDNNDGTDANPLDTAPSVLNRSTTVNHAVRDITETLHCHTSV